MLQNFWEGFAFLSFCIIVLIQLFYYWYFFARLLFYKNERFKNVDLKPISIIICAKNESANLTNNIPAVLEQKYDLPYEIVIVNDNSTDDSQEVLEKFYFKNNNIKIIELTEKSELIKGKKYPLSKGINASKYNTVLLTDADCEPATKFWLQSMQSYFSNNIDIVLGYGAYKKTNGLLNKIIRFETFHTAIQYFSYALAGNAYMGVGRNIAYNKNIFNQQNGFAKHKHIPSGDDDLFVNEATTKTNTTINIEPESFTYSVPNTKWKDWINQKKRHISTSKYYKPKHQFLLGLYSFSQVAIYPILIIALIFCNWKIVLGIFIVRIISLMIVWFGAMNKLQEKDLKPWFLFFDIGLFLYFLIFAPFLIKKTNTNWK